MLVELLVNLIESVRRIGGFIPWSWCNVVEVKVIIVAIRVIRSSCVECEWWKWIRVKTVVCARVRVCGVLLVRCIWVGEQKSTIWCVWCEWKLICFELSWTEKQQRRRISLKERIVRFYWSLLLLLLLWLLDLLLLLLLLLLLSI